MKYNASAVLGTASVLAVLLTGPHAILAEDVATGTLETYVVSPTLIATPRSEVGSSVTRITSDQIEAAQIPDLNDVLRTAPGVVTTSYGTRGALSSIFLRGTKSNQTQILIDGIRLNDANIDPGLFLGGGIAQHSDFVEILRGPQSALYGGEAMGGVVSLSTPRATAPFFSLDTTAGSFGSFASELATQMTDGSAAWSLNFGREMTHNARPHNDFDQFFYGGRFDADLSDQLRVGFTLRGAQRTFQSPGSIYDNAFNDEKNDFNLFTTWLEASLTQAWTSRVTFGTFDQEYAFNSPGYNSLDRYRKDSVDWRNTVSWNNKLTSVFGVDWETSKLDGFVQARENLVAAYGEQTVKPLPGLSLTGGGRWQEYDSFGSIWTWRTAGAYQVEATDTIFRASYGTGFSAPSFRAMYSYYPPFLPYYPGFSGNPALRPESSKGWDAGIEQHLFDHTSVGVTWFANDLQDLIETDFTSVPWTTKNVGRAHTQGLEADLHGSLEDRLFWQVAYTYLQAEDETSHKRLLRQPEHTIGFDLHTLWLNKRLTLGVGGYAIQNRADVDARTSMTIDGDDYFIGRAYGSLDVTDNLTLHLRVENVFDETYDEINGYPGRPLGVFGGVRLRF